MDGFNDHRGDARLEIKPDTNVVAPWPTFLMEAFKHNRGQALIWTLVALAPIMIIGGYLVLAYPGLSQLGPALFIGGYMAATMLAERNMCRNVMVIRQDQDRIMIDEQSWWREDERSIPDAFKYWDGKHTEAWLYRNSDDQGEFYAPFVAWQESLQIDKDTATAAHVAGVRTTMGSAQRVAKHRQRDTSEIARYGLLTLIILSGLLATYLAGSRAIDAFVAGGN